MNATDTQQAPTVTSHGDDHLNHLICCDDNRALCGTDVSRHPFVSQDDPNPRCVVCDELDPLPCPTCGW